MTTWSCLKSGIQTQVAVLYPNQKVRLEKSAHRWIYVEYFDYIEGIPKMGWVNKKYLKML